MQWWIEEANRHRQTVHNAKDGLKIAFLHSQNLLQRFASLALRFCHDHLAHSHNAVLGKKHMLGPAQPNAFGTELPGDLCIARRVRVAPHPELAITVSPCHELRKVAPEVCLNERCLAQDHLAGGAVDGQELVRLNHLVANTAIARSLINHQCSTAYDTAFPHTTCYDSGMGRHPPARRSNPLCSVHA